MIEVIDSKKNSLLIVLISVFAGLIMISGPIASKLITIGPFVTPAAVIIYAITFLITDIISECWGKKEAQFAVKVGFGCLILGAIITKTAAMIPGIIPDQNSAFKLIFDSSFRIYLASITAFLCSQTIDVLIFHKAKELTKNKHLWFRNNISTMTSQVIDTVVFITIGFYGVGIPLIDLIYGQLIIKWMIALSDTIFFYWIVNHIKYNI